MKNRVWAQSEGERRKAQKGRVRALFGGFYAPREPALMEQIRNVLIYEKQYPLKLVHKVIDRFAAMSISTSIVTFHEVVRYVKSIPDDFLIARGPCACRIHTAETLGPDGRDLASGRLDFCRETPLNVDIQIAKFGEKFSNLDAYEIISKQDLLDLEEECHNLGLVPNIFEVMGGESGICHCSSATCIPFMANDAIGKKSRVAIRGASIALLDKNRCNGSGHCVKVCHFFARSLVSDRGQLRSTMDAQKCFGCGYCEEICPEGAIKMVPRQNLGPNPLSLAKNWLKQQPFG